MIQTTEVIQCRQMSTAQSTTETFAHRNSHLLYINRQGTEQRTELGKLIAAEGGHQEEGPREELQHWRVTAYWVQVEKHTGLPGRRSNKFVLEEVKVTQLRKSIVVALPNLI